jgi:hypothetical protein
MTPRPLPLALLAAALGLLAPAEGAETTVRLFDGKTLDGWTKVGGGATYRVDDGAIVGEVGPGGNTFLRTNANYGDFRLEFDLKLDVLGNSGVQFRSHQKAGPNGRVFGYQCEVDPSPRAWSAGLYDEGRRGWLYPLQDRPQAQAAYKKDAWNHFAIEARGPVLRTWLNGVPCADLIDPVDLDGFIALQVHAGKEGRIRWKDIVLTDYGTSRPTPLFDSTSLTGWSPSGGGKWTVEAGEIRGASTKGTRSHGHLFSDARHGDFLLRAKVKPVRGDSGIYFRAEDGGAAGVKGIQVNIDPVKDTGGLYEIDGRGWLVKPDAAAVKKALKPGDWNDLAVVAIGDRVVVHLNGQKLADSPHTGGAKAGRFALQLHAGQDVDVRFKDVEVLPIHAETTR